MDLELDLDSARAFPGPPGREEEEEEEEGEEEEEINVDDVVGEEDEDEEADEEEPVRLFWFFLPFFFVIGARVALLRTSLSLLAPLAANDSESAAIPSAIAITSEPSESDDTRCRRSDEPAAATVMPLALPTTVGVAVTVAMVPDAAGANACDGDGVVGVVGVASTIRGTST